jgi:RPA family protein
MGKGTVERFGLKAIADALARAADVQSARENLSQLVNSAVEVSGTVQKRVKRDGLCRLVIEPGDVPGFVVFAGCQPDAEKVQARKIRKGSLVSVRGKFQTFGAAAVCLSDCRLDKVGLQKKKSSDKFGLKKKTENLTKPYF